METPLWSDMLYEEEQTRKTAFLRMPRAEWLACVNAYFNSLRGNGAALIKALAWFAEMETKRAEFNTPAPVPAVDNDTRNWRVWMDMVEEPEKYGEDIGEWLELDEELRRGPKRWRVDAYWNAKAREAEQRETEAATTIQALWRGVKARQHFACGTCDKCPLVAAEWDAKTPGLCRECAAATKVQALWRGHTLRYVMGPRFTCARCLAHGVTVMQGEDRCTWFCRVCEGDQLLWDAALERLDAEDDDMCADCGDEMAMYGAKVGDCWFCPECIHDWAPCTMCGQAIRHGTICQNHCRNCGDSLENATSTLGYCCTDCEYDWQQGHIDDQRWCM